LEGGGGAYGRAIEEAVKELRAATPAVVETAAGVTFTGGVFRFPFLGSDVEVTYPGGAITVDASETVVSVIIVVLHYLTRSVGPLDLSEPVRFQGIQGASAYAAAFRSHAEVPLLQRFGEDGDAYVAALLALGARPLGDADEDAEVTWEVPFLPHLPLGVRLGLAEDAMPADCVITFPRRAGFAYHVEDLAVAGEILGARLLQAAEAAEHAAWGRAGAPARDSQGGAARGDPRDHAGRPDHDLAILVTVFDPVEADMVVSKLRSAGIEGSIQAEALSVVYGLTMEGHARHHVWVRTEDLVEARGALDLEGDPE